MKRIILISIPIGLIFIGIGYKFNDETSFFIAGVCVGLQLYYGLFRGM